MKKICSKCQEAKDTNVFYKLKSKDDNLDYYCKHCRNASAKKTWSTNKKKCSVDVCDRSHYARTLCKCHYHKLLKLEKKEKNGVQNLHKM